LYLAIGSSTLHAYKEYTEPYPSAQLSPIPFSRFFDSFNGLRYWQVGGRGQCLRAGKTRSQKNA
jgi:hypothetical protein